MLATRLQVAFTQQHISGVGTITTRTYEQAIPGPTLRVRPGDTLLLTQENMLPPDPHPATEADHNVPHHFNTINLHTHGLHVSPTGDADNIFRTFPPRDQAHGLSDNTYLSRIHIPDNHPAGTFWYHPHVHGATAVQLSSGMAGVLIVEGDIDSAPEIAAAKDVVMCINELKLNTDGQVPDLRHDDDLRTARPIFLVNGQLEPVITIRPGEVQRWRLVNASAFTALPITLQHHLMHQLAMDGVAFTAPRTQETVSLAMGNRTDILVKGRQPGTYSLTAGNILLATMVVTGEPVADMQLPTSLPGRVPAIDGKVTGRRTLNFHTDHGVFPGRPFPNAYRILGTGVTPPLVPAASRTDPQYGRFNPSFVNHRLQLGDVEEWTLTNDSHMHSNHPFHLHTNHFLVTHVNGRALDPPVWQDTVGIDPNGEVVIRVCFDDFTGAAMLHCHHSQHGDEGMMQIVEYVPEGLPEQ
ncbi:multicopper oxidase domain-containing protein [Nocardia sp. NBC_01730]|uniref:multicopper oxidase family protein n=1 Tax=Nocardia sp. NBC_01730 TaxID=2975998 RepID=UPI002E0F046F|nr:multicopper oxidase domain-containing protein [Nocardia sp. NBC_01730]